MYTSTTCNHTHRLQYFITYEKLDPQSQTPRVYIGEIALKHMFKDKVLGQSGTSLDLNTLAPFHTYGHLLTVGQRAEVEKKTKEVLGMSGGGSSISVSDNIQQGHDDKGTASIKPGKPSKAAVDAANVMSLFS
jgi:hypothetical protein